jgi:phosphoribosylaminoimidazole-succinocarboxamide synthase
MNQAIPEPLYSGKVRDTYPGDDEGTLVMVASDRISVFDVVLDEQVPGKGKVLTHMTDHWLTNTPVKLVMPNHLITTDVTLMPAWAEQFDGRAMLVKKLEMLPVEAIVRGYITGSAWKDYQATGKVSGVQLPPDLQEMQEFPMPMFTPSTKAETGHDENIDISTMADLLGSRVLAHRIVDASIDLYQRGAQYARGKGIILVDTKFEFGIDPETGKLTLADEVLTPDSSRYVAIEGYETGKPPASMDKQIVRDAMATTGWDKNPPPPPIPAGVVERTVAIYGNIDERLTGVNSIIK